MNADAPVLSRQGDTEFVFRSLHGLLGVNGSVEEIWRVIHAAYTGPGRHYHDITHIDEMVRWIMFNAPDIDKTWLLWAAIFHDFVDPRATDAVFLSAVAAISYLHGAQESTPLNGDLGRGIVLVANAIMGTQSHESSDPFVQWIIDADLQRFRHPNNFYADQIRLEYPDVPDDAFNIGRAKILDFYGGRDPFFYHSEGGDEALANIARQIAELPDVN